MYQSLNVIKASKRLNYKLLLKSTICQAVSDMLKIFSTFCERLLTVHVQLSSKTRAELLTNWLTEKACKSTKNWCSMQSKSKFLALRRFGFVYVCAVVHKYFSPLSRVCNGL